MRLTDHAVALPMERAFAEETHTVYPVAVETSRGLLLVDAGPPGDADVLADRLAEHGLTVGAVEFLLLSHQDFDHCGGAASVVEAADPLVVAHRTAAPYVDGREPPLKAPASGRRYDPVPVDLEIGGGERFRTLDGPLEVVFTPGHTPGHCSFVLPEPGLLLTADAMNTLDGLGPSPPAVTIDEAAMRESIRTLADLDVERVHCHHGGPVDADGEAIRATLDDAAA